jgi:hypothetical protein
MHCLHTTYTQVRHAAKRAHLIVEAVLHVIVDAAGYTAV